MHTVARHRDADPNIVNTDPRVFLTHRLELLLALLTDSSYYSPYSPYLPQQALGSSLCSGSWRDSQIVLSSV